jgi:predicted dehydrogenase
MRGSYTNRLAIAHSTARSISLAGTRYDICLRNTLRTFRDVVRSEARNPCTAEDGLRAVKMMMAAYVSSLTGRRVEV